MQDRGRPPEHVGRGYYTTSEAQKRLGVKSRETIINMIKRGELEGDHYETEAFEKRWRATKDSVHRWLEERGRPVEVRDLEQTAENHREIAITQILSEFERIFSEHNEHTINVFVPEIEKVIQAIEAQEKNLGEQFESMRGREIEHQDRTIKVFENMEKHIEQMNERWGAVERLVGRLDERFDRLELAEEERRETGKKERRGFWRRLLMP